MIRARLEKETKINYRIDLVAHIRKKKKKKQNKTKHKGIGIIEKKKI